MFYTNIDINEVRCVLMALLRGSACEFMHEGVASHFFISVSDDVSDDVQKTLLNYGGSVDPMALWIHGARHGNNPQARRIVHLHSHYTTAPSALKDLRLSIVDQASCRFFNRAAVHVGLDYTGLDNEAEGLTTLLGNKGLVEMEYHGFMTVVESTALPFDFDYFYERAFRAYFTVLSTGSEISVLPDTISEKTAQQWEVQDQTLDKRLTAIWRAFDGETSNYKN